MRKGQWKLQIFHLRSSSLVPVSKSKGKVISFQAQCGPEGGTGITLHFHDSGTRKGWVVSSTPRRTLPLGKTRYPFYRRLNSTAGISWREDIPVSVGTYRYLPLYTGCISVSTVMFWYLSVSIWVSGWDPVKTINIFSSTGKSIPVIHCHYTN